MGVRTSKPSIAIVGAGLGGLTAAGPFVVGYFVAERGTGAVFLMFSAAAVIGALAATFTLETRSRRLEDIAP